MCRRCWSTCWSPVDSKRLSATVLLPVPLAAVVLVLSVTHTSDPYAAVLSSVVVSLDTTVKSVQGDELCKAWCQSWDSQQEFIIS